MADLMEQLPRIILEAAESNPLLGYGVIALVMFLENVVPPIPSELVMPLAGFLVEQQKLLLLPTVLAGLLGTVLGAWFWYGMGRLVNEQRIEGWLRSHGRWLGLRPEDLARSRRWFHRHGVAVVFWGRIIPGVRTFVSLPAGIELMPQPLFLAWTTAGSLIWILLLTLAGQALGASYEQIGRVLKPFGDVLTATLLGVLLLAAVAFIVLWLQKKGRVPRGKA
ncbi:DedA family protein [Cyanobium sp. NIES-981]|uniref:DedA family protein n=1 Tax=Cyanobium sp. NIES-981 TaxID=1851505 RepID=UPI0007DE1AE1|nr:DedA family protein [Cyanobium sp. NIES-981]SBO43234.1 putative membrane-associated protein [Cyanobium sp. NIES-981]